MASTSVTYSDHKIFHLSESSSAQYLVALFMAGLVYSSVVWYTKLSTPEVAAAVVNRGASMGTLVLLGFVLLLGPMTRMFGGGWRTLFMFRKELGVVAFVTGLVHVYLSMFVFARFGPFGFYVGRPWSAYPGLAALLIMAVLCFFSFHKTQASLAPTLWWKLQYLGARTAFLGIVMHVVVLRYSSWITWISGAFGGGKIAYPPAALLGALFALYIIAIRWVDFSKSQNKQSIASAVTFGFVAVVAGLFVPVISASIFG